MNLNKKVTTGGRDQEIDLGWPSWNKGLQTICGIGDAPNLNAFITLSEYRALAILVRSNADEQLNI
jgi:hypothetical protein